MGEFSPLVKMGRREERSQAQTVGGHGDRRRYLRDPA
jgi:hypothetical protein